MAIGFISYPGILAPIRMVGTRTVGVSPDKYIITAQVQSGTPVTDGTATLSFGFNGVTVNVPNALLDLGTITVSTSGHRQRFVILDRRWRWSRVYYTGAANVREPDGSIDPSTLSSVSNIAATLFAALGEAVDLSEITSTDNPEFVMDHDRVDYALQQLLGDRGYVISLQNSGVVKVWKRGRGNSLPANADLVTANISINPPEPPQLLSVCMDKTLVQSKLKCEAVGQDTDGSIRAIGNLSYAPVGGWAGTDFATFDQIASPLAKELARKTVGRWFQAATQADGTQDINFGGTNYTPGEITVSTAWQYLPLDDKLLLAATDVFGKVQAEPAFVEGTLWDDDRQGQPPVAQNTAAFTRVDEHEWTLQKKLGIVMFKKPALKKTPGPVAGKFTVADVYLTCTYAVHNTTTFVKDRLVVSRNLGGYGEDLIKLDDLQRQIVCSYSGGSAITGIFDSKANMTTFANNYLDGAQNKYVTQSANLLLYRGIYAFDTDGVTLQLRWDCAVHGKVPWGTHASQYAEAIPLLPTEFERSLIRRASSGGDPFNRRNRNFHAGRHKPRP